MPKKKKPIHKFDPGAEKKPRRQAMDRESNPSWQFSTVDWEGAFGWSNATKDDFVLVLRWMKEIEGLRWQEVLGQQSRGNSKHHFIALDKLGKQARDRLEEINQSDIDQLFSFRIDGSKRMWGIVDRHLFKILWWDPNHLVYPMNLADN